MSVPRTTIDYCTDGTVALLAVLAVRITFISLPRRRLAVTMLVGFASLAIILLHIFGAYAV